MKRIKGMPLLVAAVLMVCILILLGLLVSRKPLDSGLTEIYFSSDLPKNVSYGKEYSFSVIIHSRENAEKVYSYRILRNGVEMNNGFVSIRPDQRAMVTQSFSPKKDEEKIKFEVIVDDTSIHFWSFLE